MSPSGYDYEYHQTRYQRNQKRAHRKAVMDFPGDLREARNGALGPA
jgi:hypothetical protein